VISKNKFAKRERSNGKQREILSGPQNTRPRGTTSSPPTTSRSSSLHQ
jgi:hypothetical protein